MRGRLHSFLWILVPLLSSCAPRSALVNLWVDPEHPSGPAGNVLVVALWRDADARALWEERMVEAIETNDADATPSYTALSAPMPDSAEVFAEARRRGYDGVIVIHEHVMDRDTFYIPGYSMPKETKIPRWHRSTGGIETWMRESGGGWPAVRCDAEMWSSIDRTRMIWSGTTEVVDPGDDDHAAHTAAKTVVFELSRLGLVSSQW